MQDLPGADRRSDPGMRARPVQALPGRDPVRGAALARGPPVGGRPVARHRGPCGIAQGSTESGGAAPGAAGSAGRPQTAPGWPGRRAERPAGPGRVRPACRRAADEA